MKAVKSGKKILTFLLAVIIAASAFSNVSAERIADKEPMYATPEVEKNTVSVDIGSATVTGEVRKNATDDGFLLAVSGNGTVSLNFNAESSGKYRMIFNYRLGASNDRTCELNLKINNNSFDTSFVLPRIYKDEFKVDGEKRPQQLYVNEFVSEELRSNDHLQGEYCLFDLVEGENTVELEFDEQNIEIGKIEFISIAEIEDTARKTEDLGDTNEIIIEAEHSYRKSDFSLAPSYDISSPVTSPYEYNKLNLNIIGGSSWQNSGQWIEWEIPVDVSGYYKLSFRVRQNIKRGLSSSRRISIDGVVPFAEWESYEFKYDRDWYVETLNSNGSEMYVWLEKGTHILRMEAVMGNAIEPYTAISDSVEELNEIYRKIIMITGVSPDTNRSYNLFKRLPIKEDFKRIADELEAVFNSVENNSDGSSLTFMTQMAVKLRNYTDDETDFVASMSVFKSDISQLATLLTNLHSQPLEIDIFSLNREGNNSLKSSATFWQSLKKEFMLFINSFVKNYTDTNEKNKDTLDVWVLIGRDQAQIIKDMTSDSFEAENGIKVNVSVVSSGLNEAIVSGKGPDIVLGLDSASVINLGVRDALVDLSQFDGFDNIVKLFQETAFRPYSYQNKVYGLPGTQDFNMMFVRTDIYEEFNMKIPETWDELTVQLSQFGQYDMNAGLPSSLFTTMLLQKGLNYYNDDMTACVLDTNEAFGIYKSFAKMFTEYESPISYDAANRFRSGEMPIVITPFSFYNTFSILAPELNGKWDMYEIPGTLREDGTIDRSTEATGTAAVIVNGTEHAEEAFAYLEWWSSTEVQSRFCREIENVLGTAGRYSTANTEAFESLNWSVSQLKAIREQRKSVSEIPGSPVSYIVTRNLNNIFVNVVENNANIREALIKYSAAINNEIERKNEELLSHQRRGE